MRKRLDEATLDAIFAAPLEIVARLRAPWGSVSAFPTREEITSFLNDPEEWYAQNEGVTKEDYLAWISSDGLPRCGTFLSNGERCKNSVSGGTQRGLHEWLQADAGFCHMHGGDSSKAAKHKRLGKRPK